MKKWIYIRSAIISIAVLATLWDGPISTHATPPIRGIDLIIGFFFGILGLQFILLIQSVNRWSASVWIEPSWKENPFSFKQPVQFFHFGTWLLIPPSLISTIEAAFYKSDYIIDALMPLCFGIGVLAGVHLSKIIFRKKFVSSIEVNRTVR